MACQSDIFPVRHLCTYEGEFKFYTEDISANGIAECTNIQSTYYTNHVVVAYTYMYEYKHTGRLYGC